jgi:hypothetical protein
VSTSKKAKRDRVFGKWAKELNGSRQLPHQLKAPSLEHQKSLRSERFGTIFQPAISNLFSHIKYLYLTNIDYYARGQASNLNFKNIIIRTR